MQPNESQSPLTCSPEQAGYRAGKRIPAAAVRDLCGGICRMSLWRWLNDPALNFPRPIYIGRRRYWREADVLAWLNAREVAA